MEQNETVLMNFNISPILKTTFYDVCRYKNISMTSQLNMLIDSFVKRELYEFKQQQWMEEQKKLPVDFYSTWFENNPSAEDWY